MATVPETDWHDFYPAGIEPTWEIALLYPPQGGWSEFDYLDLTDSTNRLVEFTDGNLEVLAMPKTSHQRILTYLFSLLQAHILPSRRGEALCAPLRLSIRKGKIREPDIVFIFHKNRGRIGEEKWNGADLVMEVVSNDPESRKREYEQKKLDYAEGSIPEYWIVDPQEKKIPVLILVGNTYQQHGVFAEGETATSQLLAGFSVNVTDVFQAAKA